MYQKDDLRKWTDIYWSETGEHAKNYYLGPLEGFDSHKRPPRPLLYLEMECAKANGYLPKRDDRPITLAFLVGDSFEPLLQSICAYKPARLVPVVNAYYGDRDPPQRKKGWNQWRDLRELINRLTVEFKPPSALLEPGQLKTAGFQEDGTDAPVAVFNFLRQELQEDLADSKRRVVVDITGAKKTMVVGAFLFAAYTNADIAYVDFNAYDPERGKPYGFTCRFITVDNPLNHFALQEWERIAQLYEQHDFSGALALLPTELPVSLGEWNKQLDQLRQFLEVCAFWENGQLHQGNSTQGSLPGHLRQLVPSSIALLGDYWPSPDKGYESWVAKEFLLDPHSLVIYARDELARCQRLLAEKNETRQDYRAAFVRAYALHETLLKARAVALYVKGFLRVRKSKNSCTVTELPPEWYIAGLNWCLNRMRGDPTLQLIATSSEQKPIRCPYWLINGNKEYPEMWRVFDRGIPVYRPETYFQTGVEREKFDEFVEELADKRNLVVHTYAPATDGLVKQAIELAEANLQDYCENWGKWTKASFNPKEQFEPTQFDTPTWGELKSACKLDFIPDKRKREDLA